MHSTPMRFAFLAISVLATFAEMHIFMLTIQLFAMTAGRFYTRTLMGNMLTILLLAMLAFCIFTSAVIGHLMKVVRLTIWFVAMIAQNIIASGAFMLHVLTIFLITMFALGIFTPAIRGRSMSYMLAVFSLTMLTDYNLAKAPMLDMLTG